MDNARNTDTAPTAARRGTVTPAATPPVSVDIRASDIQSVRVIDTDLVITTREGKRVVIRDGALRAMLEPQFVVSFADGDMSGATLFHQAGDSTPQNLRLITVGPNQGDLAQGNADPTVPQAGSDPRGVGDLPPNATPERAQDTAPASAMPPTPLPDERPAGIAIGDTGVLPPPPKAEDGATAPSAPDSSPWKIFDLAQNINALSVLSALGGIGLLAGGGGGGSAAAGSAGSDSVLASITVVAGTFINAVQVDIYDAGGHRVGGGLSDSAGGHFSGTLALTAGYSGTLLVKVSDVSGGAPDYLNEATGQSTSLGTALRSVINYTAGSGSILSATVTPLTELAARLITGSSDSANALTPSVSAADAAAINQAVASAFGLPGITGDGVAVVGSAGFASSSASAKAYGAVLAALAGYDTQSGGIAQTLDALWVDTASGQLLSGAAVLATGASLVQGTDSITSQSLASQVQSLLSPVVSASSSLALTFTSGQIAALSAPQVSGLSATQWGLMSASQIAGLGANSAGLTSADVLAFNPAQIAALSTGALAGLATQVIAALPIIDIGALSTTQLGALTHAQDLAWTTAQKAAMSQAQLAVLH